MTALYSAMAGLTRYNVVVVGAPGVGKTCFVRTLAREPRPQYYNPTRGVSVLPVQIATEAELIIHDVGGTVPPKSTQGILSKADAVVLMYDYFRLDETLGVLDKDWIPAVTAFAHASATLVQAACNVPVDKVNKCFALPLEQEDAFWERLQPKLILMFASEWDVRDKCDVSRSLLYQSLREGRDARDSPV